jgi:putative ABC transport system ATP-binding protein
LRALSAFVVEALQQRLFVRAVADIARRLPRVDVGGVPAESGPELVNRFFDVVMIQKAAAALLLDGVSVALQAGVGMVLLAFYHPLLLAFDIVLLIALTALIMVPLRGAIRSSLKESSCKYETVAWLEEGRAQPRPVQVGVGDAPTRWPAPRCCRAATWSRAGPTGPGC